MLPYYMLIFLPILPLLLRRNERSIKKRNRRAINTFFCVYLLLLSLRHLSVGRDLASYSRMFLLFSRLDWSDVFSVDVEAGYVLLNRVIAAFTNDFQWVIVVTSFFTIIPIWILYNKKVESAYLTISLFIVFPTFVMFFSGLRQSLAIAVGVIAFEMAEKKKPLLFLLFVLIAFSFHRSAAILLIIYPIYNARITKKWLIVAIPCLISIYVWNKPIFTFLQLVLHDYYEGEIMETGAYSMLLLFVLLGLYSYMIPDEREMTAEDIGLRNLLLVAIALQLFAPIHNLAMRVNYYFIIFIPLLIPKVASLAPAGKKQVAVLSSYVMVAFFIIYFFVHMVPGNVLDTFPYSFFWEGN